MARASSRVKAIVKKAENHVKAKDFAAAGLIVRDGLAEFPGNPKLLHLAGRTHYHMGDYTSQTIMYNSSTIKTVYVFKPITTWAIARRARLCIIPAL